MQISKSYFKYIKNIKCFNQLIFFVFIFALTLVCNIYIISLQVFANENEASNAPEKEITKLQPAISVESPSALLIEASTGSVIYEKDADTRRSPASVTKIMTLLLTFDALTKGQLSLGDEVVTSAYAKSMGGSQVFLEEGEVQTVETLIKCVAVASGNDASVALAEYIAGSEDEFVRKMNERAVGLGMNNTNFEDSCGLTTSSNHYTTARDIAAMSRELITKYPNIYNYTKIWMEDIVHTTSRGSAPFTLSSTNKLLKQYQWATGLKTGSTSIAKFCLSATAQKDGIDLIAVVLAAPEPTLRFLDAVKLFNYGYSVSRVFGDDNLDEITPVLVERGVEERVAIEYQGTFKYLDTTGSKESGLKKEIHLNAPVVAPLERGSLAGQAVYYLGEKEVGRINLIYGKSVEEAKYSHHFLRATKKFLP